MKKIWRIRKDSEAVSPVIATILMVAITVVLAAVLYVMVMGFGGSTNQTPSGSFTAVQSMSASVERVQFGVITNPTVKPTELKIVIENLTTSTTDTARTYTFASDATGALTAVSGTGTITGLLTVAYTDLAGDAKVSSGDYLTITFGPSGGTSVSNYKVSMIFISTGAVIDDTTFVQ
jgi:flagellin-like protein